MAANRRNGDRHLGTRVQFWVPVEVEIEMWRDAAKAEGMTMSAWLRRAANRAVEIEAKQQHVREVL